MMARYGQYIYMAAWLALGLCIAIYARYDYRKWKRSKFEKDEHFGASASRLPGRTSGQTSSGELLREGGNDRDVGRIENQHLTLDEREALHYDIKTKASELENLYQKLPDGRRKTLALTDLEVSVMWSIKELTA